MCDCDTLCPSGVCGEGAADGEDEMGAWVVGECSCTALGIDRERLFGLFLRAERLACTLGETLIEELEEEDTKPCAGTEIGDDAGGAVGPAFLIVRTGTRDCRESGGSMSNATSSSFCCVGRKPLM